MVNLPIEYSDKPVTAFGGMSLLKRMLDKLGIVDQLRSLSFPQPGLLPGRHCPFLLAGNMDRGFPLYPLRLASLRQRLTGHLRFGEDAFTEHL